jgi:hypothetical protein
MFIKSQIQLTIINNIKPDPFHADSNLKSHNCLDLCGVRHFV